MTDTMEIADRNIPEIPCHLYVAPNSRCEIRLFVFPAFVPLIAFPVHSLPAKRTVEL